MCVYVCVGTKEALACQELCLLMPYRLSALSFSLWLSPSLLPSSAPLLSPEWSLLREKEEGVLGNWVEYWKEIYK